MVRVLMSAIVLISWAGISVPSYQAASIHLPVAFDINPDPNIVEIRLEAKLASQDFMPPSTAVGCAVNRAPTPVWSYNGTVPGPMIEAKVGDTLIVHFTNRLPESTTIHWHGLEVPATMDGSNLSQLEVPGNGGTFRYEFKLLKPATYWYHPHIRSNEQIEKGLYGALVVADAVQDQQYGLPPTDATLVLDDVLLDENNRIAEPFPMDPLARAVMQVYGREGNHLLVNGSKIPTLFMYPNEPQRLRLINAANARFFRLSIPGHTIYQIGGDGGLLETPTPHSPIDMVANPSNPAQLISNQDAKVGLLLTPGERADVLLVPQGAVGDSITVEWHDIRRGKPQASYNADQSINLQRDVSDGTRAPIPLMKIILMGNPSPSNFSLPTTLRKITPLPTNGAALPVVFGHTMPDLQGNVTFFARVVNMQPLPFDQVSAADALSVTVGENRVWEVINQTGADHPLHAHGWFFQPIETVYKDATGTVLNREPWPRLEEKDTVRVPARPGMMGTTTTLRLAVHFDDVGREGQVAAYGKTASATDSGGWVYHCHMLDHADLGMMSFLNVQYPSSPIP